MLSADTHLYCFSKVLLAPYHNRIPAIGIVPKTRWRSPVWLPIFWCSNVTETRRPEGYGLRFEYRASDRRRSRKFRRLRYDDSESG